jgi:uncharacterized protein involved in type VI secretion and phage assembly
MNTGFFGKYRGTVTDNKDLQFQGRVKVKVPYAMGDVEDWAMPCVPYAAMQAGVFIVPPVGANVWVEFEGGDVDHPIWVGGFYPLGAAPVAALVPVPPGTEEVVIQVGSNNMISIKDLAGPIGGIVLKSGQAMIMVNDQGITLMDGSGGIISMLQGIVSINPPNLVVMK